MTQRVLMVASVPSMIGQFNMNNINILKEMGYQVEVAANFKDTSIWPPERIRRFKEKMDEMGIKCIQLDFSRHPLSFRRHIKTYKEIKKIARGKKYAFIHTHTPIASALVRLATHTLGIKVIYTAHGFHFYKGAPVINWILYYPIEKVLSRFTDVLITINKEDYNRANSSFHAKETVFIPGVGVDTEKFASCSVDKHLKRNELGVEESDFLMLSVGELSERKNQKVVIDALDKMNEKNLLGNIVYLIVGEGDMRDAFEKMIDEKKLKRHVKILGFRSDIDELCKTVDCFVHTSIREGLGIAPLEAMAVGLPLITSYVNGIKDYTEDGVSGCCIAPTDVDAMVSAIQQMKDNPDFRDKCGRNNATTAKDYDIEKTKKIMIDVYSKMQEHC